MISRWISLVPSQIRSTRSSRQEPLGDVVAPVAAAAEGLHGAVGAAARGLADEQLRHRRLGVHELGVGARVGEPRDLQHQQPPGRRVGRRVGQREGDALVVPEPRAALLAPGRPGERVVQQPLHRADPARRDAEPLLGEPRALQVVGAAERPEHRVRPDLDVEAQRRMPVRIGVGVGRVVDDLDPAAVRGHGEERRALRRDRDDDDHVGHVAARHEPLLAPDPPAAARRAARPTSRSPTGPSRRRASVTA